VPSQGSNSGGKHLLLVDDSTFFRDLSVPMLSAAGFRVTAVSSAAEALNLRDSGLAVDAIVSDIEMPGMDGLGFARTIRKGGAWAGVPLVALTGTTAPDAVRTALAAGFTDYVAKFDRDALINSLRQHLAEPAVAH
jgi:two-component system chemotaxis sensor kinase CheA